MKIFSAITYGLGFYLGGLGGEIWHMHSDPSYSPELGFGCAVIGLFLFAVIHAVMIYVYGVASKSYRRDDNPVNAYVISAMAGIPFYFIIMPLHRYLTKVLDMPNGIWWVETVLICAISFEVIRLFDRLWRKKNAKSTPGPNQSFNPDAAATSRFLPHAS